MRKREVARLDSGKEWQIPDCSVYSITATPNSISPDDVTEADSKVRRSRSLMRVGFAFSCVRRFTPLIVGRLDQHKLHPRKIEFRSGLAAGLVVKL